MNDVPQAGQQAPDFTLPSTKGEVRLSELWREKKVVLAFYVEDGTPACTRAIRTFSDEYYPFIEAGAEVVAVSADSLESHQAFVEKLGDVPFPLVADTELEAARLYGVVDETGRRSRRAVFVIDQGGRIRHVVPWYNPNNPAQYFEVVEALAESFHQGGPEGAEER